MYKSAEQKGSLRPSDYCCERNHDDDDKALAHSLPTIAQTCKSSTNAERWRLKKKSNLENENESATRREQQFR